MRLLLTSTVSSPRKLIVPPVMAMLPKPLFASAGVALVNWKTPPTLLIVLPVPPAKTVSQLSCSTPPEVTSTELLLPLLLPT